MKKFLPYDCVLCAGSVASVYLRHANDASDATDANAKVQSRSTAFEKFKPSLRDFAPSRDFFSCLVGFVLLPVKTSAVRADFP